HTPPPSKYSRPPIQQELVRPPVVPDHDHAKLLGPLVELLHPLPADARDLRLLAVRHEGELAARELVRAVSGEPLAGHADGRRLDAGRAPGARRAEVSAGGRGRVADGNVRRRARPLADELLPERAVVGGPPFDVQAVEKRRPVEREVLVEAEALAGRGGGGRVEPASV